MTVPLAALLGFAGWTVLLLLGTVGVQGWSRTLTGRDERAMRADANCVEFVGHGAEAAGPG